MSRKVKIRNIDDCGVDGFMCDQCKRLGFRTYKFKGKLICPECLNPDSVIDLKTRDKSPLADVWTISD